jgi:ABC-type polysaccharide/polyol phosphate export permease
VGIEGGDNNLISRGFMSERMIVTEFDSQGVTSFLQFIDRNIKEMRIFRFALAQFVINALRTRYRRSVLGFLWTLLNPLLSMSVMTVVFAVIFKANLREFGIYVFSGLAPWTFINNSIVGGSVSIINSEGFLKKVYLPKLLFPMITVTTETVNFFFSILALLIIGLVLGFQLTWTILWLPVVILILYLFSLGLTIIFSIANVYFRDLFHILTVVFMALFYAVPIIYPIEAIPVEYRGYFNLNPFFYFINLFRKVIYGTPITQVDWAVPIGLALLSLVVGLYLLMRHNSDLVFRL